MPLLPDIVGNSLIHVIYRFSFAGITRTTKPRFYIRFFKRRGFNCFQLQIANKIQHFQRKGFRQGFGFFINDLGGIHDITY